MATSLDMSGTKADQATMAAPSAQNAIHVGSRSRMLLSTGGVCGVVGAVMTFITNGLHPHPSDFRLESLLAEIAQNPVWPGLHLALIFGMVLIFAALLAITLTIEGGTGAAVARFACLVALLGGALILVSTAMDGFSISQLARSWHDAAPGEKAGILRIADAFENAQYAIYSLSVIFFIGAGIFLYGLATILSSNYPRILGWLAMLSGAGAFVVGIVQTLAGPDFRATEIFFVLFSMLSTLWVLVMGVLMWRKALPGHANDAVS
jgi:hypothetical protein